VRREERREKRIKNMDRKRGERWANSRPIVDEQRS
jgi:hypothetical protein